jgi:hypothetical protein
MSASVSADWTLDVRIAPEGALGRVSSSINKRKKRLFGVLKTEKEFVGVVRDGGFEIWERQQRAVHAIGKITRRRGGSRIELRFVLPLRTRLLLAVFFGLYTVAAVGIASQGVHGLSLTSGAIVFGGSIALIALFAGSARRQRDDLRAFVRAIFAEDDG